MASRNRRRRYNTDAVDEQSMKEHGTVKIKFAEELDYKMEIEQP